MRYIKFFCIFIIFCIFISPAINAKEEIKKSKLIVIGVRNEINKPEWESQLIGYGLAHLLLQGLFDTGRYILLEDNPEILKETQKLVSMQWKQQAPFYTEQEVENISKKLGGESAAYAKVKNCSVKRKRNFMGPMSGAETTVKVELEVYLKESGKPSKISSGIGEASTKSVGTFFEIRNDKIYFDKTTVGQAAEKAIKQAIKGLIIN